jgi:hypothetical protein
VKSCRELKEKLNSGIKVNLECESIFVIASVLKVGRVHFSYIPLCSSGFNYEYYSYLQNPMIDLESRKCFKNNFIQTTLNFNKYCQSGMVVHFRNLSTWETEIRGL